MEQALSFGTWLTQFRQSLGLQRAELANRIGSAVITLRKIEADERRPSRQLAERLADELAIPPAWREVFIRVARGELPVARLALPRPAAAGLTNLPFPATTLAGRVREVGEVANLLERVEVRLLTLTGAPGVGKTRLALEVAHTLHGAFADGVFFVPLAPLTDPALVLSTIAHTLHVGTAGRQPQATRLGHYLRSRQVLLILDNFEHLLAAEPHLGALLRAAPYLKLLVTSRIALELSGEYRLIVLPLAVPPAADNRRRAISVAETQERYPAVDLFVARAGAVNPGLELNKTNLRAIGEICRRLDGLPLAIELAAARTALFTPQELLARLDARFTLLTSGSRDLPARHMTLGRAIDWSYSLLTPPEQRLFRRLSVFVGGCTLEAAQAVVGAADPDTADVAESMGALVGGSLLQRLAGTDGHSRFGMLDTIHEYAAARLRASGEQAAVQAQHAAYYLAMATAAEQTWDTPAEWDWLRRLVAERDNLRAALQWALDTHDAALALRLNAALFSFWGLCSAQTEARHWLEAALALPRPAPLEDLRAVEAKVLNLAGYVATIMADYPRAAVYFERGLVLYQALEDSRGIAWSIRGCAFAQMLHEEYTPAGQRLDESLRLCRASGDAWGEAWSLYARAFLLLAKGDLNRARPALEEALAHLRRQNIPLGIFRALLALGHILFVQGDQDHAAELYREGLRMSREAPLITMIPIGVDGLAAVAAHRGQATRAARLWGAAEALREATDEHRWSVFQPSYESALAAAQAQLTPAAWATAWGAGRALSAAEAVAEALAQDS